MPVRSTRMSTSLMPTAGTGTSSSHSPGSGFFLTRARMVFIGTTPSQGKVPSIPQRAGRGRKNPRGFSGPPPRRVSSSLGLCFPLDHVRGVGLLNRLVGAGRIDRPAAGGQLLGQAAHLRLPVAGGGVRWADLGELAEQ